MTTHRNTVIPRMSCEIDFISMKSVIFFLKKAKRDSSTPPAKIISSSHLLLNSGEIGKVPNLLTMTQ